MVLVVFDKSFEYVKLGILSLMSNGQVNELVKLVFKSNGYLTGNDPFDVLVKFQACSFCKGRNMLKLRYCKYNDVLNM